MMVKNEIGSMNEPDGPSWKPPRFREGNCGKNEMDGFISLFESLGSFGFGLGFILGQIIVGPSGHWNGTQSDQIRPNQTNASPRV